MPADLTGEWPPRWKGSNFKTERGLHTRERKATQATVKTREKKEKIEAKKRDVKGCRWPKDDHETKRHVCEGQLESAHMVAVGMGGDKNGTRTDRRELLTVCTWIHTGSPLGIEYHGRKWEPLDPKLGAYGPVAFYRREPSETKPGEWGNWKLIAVEASPGLLESKPKLRARKRGE